MYSFGNYRGVKDRSWTVPLSELVLSEVTLRLNRYLNRCGSLPVPREDLVGEVLLRLLASSAAQEIQHPFAYAKMILQNLIRDHLRRAERAERVMETLAATRPESIPGLEAVRELDDGEFIKYLLENARLSPLQDKVVRMVYLDGMKPIEVARELSKNPGTIQRHLHRALEKLETCAAGLELRT